MILTPDKIEEIRARHEVRKDVLRDGAFFATENAKEDHDDIDALLSHISALQPSAAQAYRDGAEAMREAAANLAEDSEIYTSPDFIAEKIRALKLDGR